MTNDIMRCMQFVKVSDSNTDLYIYGDIRTKNLFDIIFGDDQGRVDALSFAEALAKVDTPMITVHINSYGGDVGEGLAIYSQLSQFTGHVKTLVDGFACSAASVVFMAGDERIVPESGLLMIHNAWVQNVSGNSNELRKCAEDLDKITQPSLDIYCAKTKLEEAKVKELMDKETWITSKEAIEMGFSTGTSAYEAVQTIESNYVHKLIEKIKSYENELEKIKCEKCAPKNSWSNFFAKK